MTTMRKHLLTGIIILLPVVVTVVIIVFIVNILTQPFVGFVSNLLSQYHIINRGILFLSPEQTVRYGSQLVILICIFFLIWVLGFLAKRYFIHMIINLVEKIMHRLPLVNKIYKTTKEVVVNIFSQDKQSFKQVVVVPFPGEGIYVLGFVTTDAPLACCLATKKELVGVFVPTTPNPTTGFLLMYTKDQVRNVDMKVELAIKYIVSCGLVSNLEQEEPAKA